MNCFELDRLNFELIRTQVCPPKLNPYRTPAKRHVHYTQYVLLLYMIWNPGEHFNYWPKGSKSIFHLKLKAIDQNSHQARSIRQSHRRCYWCTCGWLRADISQLKEREMSSFCTIKLVRAGEGSETYIKQIISVIGSFSNFWWFG